MLDNTMNIAHTYSMYVEWKYAMLCEWVLNPPVAIVERE